jgi:diacylglycerol O-acyltransferase / wax synthase
VSPLLVPVPTRGPLDRRLAEVATTVRAGKEAAAGPPPIAVLGWLFRPLARLGGYRWYMTRQRRFHTLVSHVRGPAVSLSFGGRRITGATPLGVAEGGNATTSFQVLSYDGTLTLTAIVDPDRVPDVEVLAGLLRSELLAVAGSGGSAGPDR